MRTETCHCGTVVPAETLREHSDSHFAIDFDTLIGMPEPAPLLTTGEDE